MTYVILRVWYILPLAIYSSSALSIDINTSLKIALSKLPNAPTYKYLEDLRGYYKYSALAQTKQNHWSFSSEYNYNTLNEQDDIQSSRRIKDENYQVSLAYTDWSGLDMSLARQNNNELYQVPLSSDLKNEYYTNTLQISYELIKAGRNGLSRSQSYSGFHNFKSEYEGISSSQIDLVKSYQEHFINYFTSLCKIKFLKQSQIKNNIAFKKARAAFKTDNLSKKDFLNIKITSNSVALEIIQQTNQQKLLLEQSTQYGLIYKKYLQELNSDSVVCSLDHSLEWVKIDEKKLLTSHPKIKKSIQQILKSKQDINYIKANYKPSVKPFVRLSNGPESFTEYDNQALAIGVQATWIIPSDKSQTDLKSYLAQKRYATSSLNNDKISLATEIKSLETQFNNNKQTLIALKNNISTFDELLKLLRAQIQVGRADSITYANTYGQYVSSQVNALDVFSELIKAKAYLEIIKKSL